MDVLEYPQKVVVQNHYRLEIEGWKPGGEATQTKAETLRWLPV